jgi:3',5'-cyclic AMP phosphodiesterase CpdA
MGRDLQTAGSSRTSLGLTLAHLSDLHITAVHIQHPGQLLNKRLLGWLSWRTRRRKEHRAPVLEALLRDLGEARIGHVGVTGDLTNLGLESELEAAAGWLERLGPPDRVSIVPGNHDVYAGPIRPERWRPWAPYMSPDGAVGLEAVEFPYVRHRGGVALVGVSSARPTAPLLATGRVGKTQRERLAATLRRLGEAGLFRVVLMHHPPLSAGQSRRRQLDDANAVRSVLGEVGAELVLHGHTHRSHWAHLAGPSGKIPVVGVPSSSSVGTDRPERRARYHIYAIEPDAEAGGFRLGYRVRGYDPSRDCFVEESGSAL